MKGEDKGVSILSHKCIRLSMDFLPYRFDGDFSLRKTNMKKHFLYSALYDGLFISDLLNHH